MSSWHKFVVHFATCLMWQYLSMTLYTMTHTTSHHHLQEGAWARTSCGRYYVTNLRRNCCEKTLKSRENSRWRSHSAHLLYKSFFCFYMWCWFAILLHVCWCWWLWLTHVCWCCTCADVFDDFDARVLMMSLMIQRFDYCKFVRIDSNWLIINTSACFDLLYVWRHVNGFIFGWRHARHVCLPYARIPNVLISYCVISLRTYVVSAVLCEAICVRKLILFQKQISKYRKKYCKTKKVLHCFLCHWLFLYGPSFS